jgi:hypothetical protein
MSNTHCIAELVVNIHNSEKFQQSRKNQPAGSANIFVSNLGIEKRRV